MNCERRGIIQDHFYRSICLETLNSGLVIIRKLAHFNIQIWVGIDKYTDHAASKVS